MENQKYNSFQLNAVYLFYLKLGFAALAFVSNRDNDHYKLLDRRSRRSRCRERRKSPDR